jgi:RNA polymerase sigma-70 factor (ECF subfamily)
MDPSTVGQPALVRRARSGDRDAFSRLAAGQIDRLYATAYLVLRAQEPARDAVQEALIDAWRGLPALRDPDRFGPWLHRLLLHRCSRHRPRADREFELGTAPLLAIQDATGEVADRDQLERGFRRLPTDQRMVLVLRFYIDMSVDDMADVLGLSSGTVKSRTSRALSALRALLEADARPAPAARGSES